MNSSTFSQQAFERLTAQIRYQPNPCGLVFVPSLRQKIPTAFYLMMLLLNAFAWRESP